MSRSLVQGLFTGIIVLFFVMAGIPGVRMVGGFFCCVPIIIATIRYGPKYALLVTLFSALVLAIILEPLPMLTFFSGGIFGLLLGILIREGFSPGRILLIGGVVLVLIFGLEIAISSQISNSSSTFRIVDNLTTHLKEYREYLFSSPAIQSGISLGDLEGAKEFYDLFISKLPMLIPAMLILGAFIYTYLSYEISRSILGKMGYQLTKFLPLSILRVPDIFIWGFILGWMAILVGGLQGIWSLYVIGLNIRCIFEAIYAVVGFGIAHFFLNKYNVPGIARILTYIILVFGLKIVMFVGVFDTWFDFRRLKATKSPIEI